MPTITANQLTGRAIGALFFAAFGSAWLALWLAATQRLYLTTGLAIGLGLVALVGVASWVLRRARYLPARPLGETSEQQARRESRVFGIVNAGQWGAIFLLGWVLPRLGLASYLTPAIVAIVGLHLFPLARLFHYRSHYLTGAALLGWTAGCLLLTTQSAWQAWAALGAGSILWLSAAHTLWKSIQTLRQLPPATPKQVSLPQP